MSAAHAQYVIAVGKVNVLVRRSTFSAEYNTWHCGASRLHVYAYARTMRARDEDASGLGRRALNLASFCSAVSWRRPVGLGLERPSYL